MRDSGLEIACWRSRDAVTWGIYADWLDDHGDSEQSVFFRSQGQEHADIREWQRLWKRAMAFAREQPKVIHVTPDFYLRIQDYLAQEYGSLGIDMMPYQRQVVFRRILVVAIGVECCGLAE